MKENVFDYALQRVERGAKFSVNLKERTLVIEGKRVIDHGKHKMPLGLDATDTDDALACIDTYYRRYRHSVPSEASERRRRLYFRALDVDELSARDMAFGMRREQARCVLEVYTLISIMNGSLVWDDTRMGGKVFYKSVANPQLILMRDWIEPKA